MSLTQFKLEDSPTAEECRAVLGDLPTAKEKRKGKTWYVFLYISLICGGGVILLSLIDHHPINGSTPLIISIFIWIFIFISLPVSISYESKLCNNNKIDDLINFIQPSLKKDERFLAMSVGNTFGQIKVDWITGNINRYSYFIFTTDRLIVITFSPHFAGTDLISNTITDGTFEKGISKVYTCSLANKKQVQYGGMAKHVVAIFTWTAIKIAPIKKTDLHTWYLADKHTANGKIIKTIFKRLSNKRNF